MSTSVQLGEYKAPPVKVTVGAKQLPAIEINYKRVDGEHNTDMKVRYLVGRLDDTSREVLQSLKDGDKFVVVKEKQGEYWNLKEFKPASEYKAREMKPQNMGTNRGSYQKKEYDDTGVKVGAARNQAIALLMGLGLFDHKTKMETVLDEVDRWAYEIVSRQSAQEATVRNGRNIAPTTEDNFTNDVDQDDVPF